MFTNRVKKHMGGIGFHGSQSRAYDVLGDVTLNIIGFKFKYAIKSF